LRCALHSVIGPLRNVRSQRPRPRQPPLLAVLLALRQANGISFDSPFVRGQPRQEHATGVSGAMTSFKVTPDGPSFATHLSKLYNAAKSNIYEILVGQLFDPVSRGLLSNQVITVDRDTGLILAVQPQGEARVRASNVEPTKIDLSHLTVLPGFVDTHVHREVSTVVSVVANLPSRLVFLRPYSEASWEDQLTKESLPERTLRASVHARKTLQAGFTTVR